MWRNQNQEWVELNIIPTVHFYVGSEIPRWQLQLKYHGLYVSRWTFSKINRCSSISGSAEICSCTPKLRIIQIEAVGDRLKLLFILYSRVDLGADNKDLRHAGDGVHSRFVIRSKLRVAVAPPSATARPPSVALSAPSASHAAYMRTRTPQWKFRAGSATISCANVFV